MTAADPAKTKAALAPPGPASHAADVFALSTADLSKIIDFDSRGDADYVQRVFHAEAGGQAGLAQALRTDFDRGLDCFAPGEAGAAVPQAAARSGFLGGLFGAGTASESSQALQPRDAAERVRLYGINKVEVPPRPSLLKLIWDFIKTDVIVQVLLVGATIVLILGTATNPERGWYEGTAIFVAVGIVLVVTSLNDYIKEGKFRKMMELGNDRTIKVIRGGQSITVSTFDLLVGDVVILSVGDEIPADGFVISSSRLAVDESPLTGEPIAVKKDPVSAPFVFGGTFVGEGSGTMCVTAVGRHSAGGKIQHLLFLRGGGKADDGDSIASSTSDFKGATDNVGTAEMTPLQLRLRKVAILVGKVGVAAGIVTFLALSIRWALGLANQLNSGTPFEASMLIGVVEAFVVGVTIVVVAVPEGLPLTVTILLAYSMLRMIKENCFVRHLDASETMGEATCICTDKTGTLTENRMTVVKVLSGGRSVELERAGAAAEDPAAAFGAPVRELLAEAVSVNSTAFIRQAEPAAKGKPAGGAPEFVGSATEGAMLVFSGRIGYPDYEAIRKSTETAENGVWPFSSVRKRMSTLVVKPHGYRLHVKGASEILLGLCTRRTSSTGDIAPVPILPAERADLERTIREWASEGLRTIGIAYRDVEKLPDMSAGEASGEGANPLETDLVFLALVGIKDPLRKEVPAAVAACQGAGMVVRMVTGDNILTATKIAAECGILDVSKGHVAIEGPEFRAMTDDERRAILPSMRVLARSSPSDKFILVSLLRALGETVAVTGDGTNDAAALNEADVGFAMGISGTQIAMNASDIVLTDDNFSSIVNGIRWGRNVYDGIRKFLQFQLSVNVIAIVLTLVGSVAWGRAPLNTVQLLWVNLIMDSLGAVALASDRPGEEILKQKPHSRSEHVINKGMYFYMGCMIVFQLAMLLCLLFFGETMVMYTETPGEVCDYNPYTVGHEATWLDSCRGTWILTVTFTTFIMLQIFNLVTCRQLDFGLNVFRGLDQNWIFHAMIAGIVAVQVVVVQFGSGFVGTVPLGWREWLLCTAWASLLPIYVVLTRIARRVFLAWWDPSHPQPARGEMVEAGKAAEVAIAVPLAPLRESPSESTLGGGEEVGKEVDKVKREGTDLV
ncbi:hypothetical protein DFJ74DRAFT_438222 [Hyaloraphidium curvatum]|nr:hypothetical protein DFJ74DRAFT_438222 [Hyaloraphidium curvatum]